ncbi:MAG: sulfide/dihydroorotate dehydrogenase-like FAD/NAD-binding protein [Saccharofermentanales bacterium]
MFEIITKESLNPQTRRMQVYAPHIAAKAKPGQFIIFRVNEKGERIPLTVADTDKQAGTVTIIFQEVGLSTRELGELEVGDRILDFVGPLGRPSHLEGIRRVCVVGGGLGCAIAFPQAKQLFLNGAEVDIIAGFRTKDLVILEDDMKAVSTNFYLCTDDGTYGRKGLVTEMLKERIEAGEKYDEVIVVGPLPMMKFVSLLTKQYGIKTTVSMNTIMIDGTGMCGGCRLTVGGETKFACVDGPEFDGHLINFDEAIRRVGMYKDIEKEKSDEHACRLQKE